MKSKIIGFLNKRGPYNFITKNWDKISNILGKVDFAYEMISNPIRTSVVKILNLFSEDFKTVKIVKGYYDNFLTLIKDYTFGFSAFKNNVTFLRKKVLSEPKRKKPKVAKIKPYFKKHPKYLYGASKAAQKILWPGYKSKRSYSNKNTKPIKHSTKNILYKGLNFIKNKILRKI